MNVTEATERARLVDGLHELADFLEGHADAPLPLMPRLGVHITSRTEFEQAAAAVGATIVDYESDHYAHANVTFGPIVYSIQTVSGRRASLAEREARIAQREAELGIDDEQATS